MINLIITSRHHKDCTKLVTKGLISYIWAVKDEFSAVNNDIVITREKLITLAANEIKEWFKVFEEDKDYELSYQEDINQIRRHLKEDGFPEEIISEAIHLQA